MVICEQALQNKSSLWLCAWSLFSIKLAVKENDIKSLI